MKLTVVPAEPCASYRRVCKTRLIGEVTALKYELSQTGWESLEGRVSGETNKRTYWMRYNIRQSAFQTGKLRDVRSYEQWAK